MHLSSGPRSYSSTVLQHWDRYKNYVQEESSPPPLDGTNLILAYIVAVARYVNPDVVNKRSEFLKVGLGMEPL